MKALTLREPWASLVAIGAKRVETRSWRAPEALIGQRIAIHASAGLTSDEVWIACDYRFLNALDDGGVRIWADRAAAERGRVKDAFASTRGKVLATATLLDCVPHGSINSLPPKERVLIARTGEVVRVNPAEYEFGNYGPGRYGWLLSDVKRLDDPIPATGMLGLWEWDPSGTEGAK